MKFIFFLKHKTQDTSESMNNSGSETVHIKFLISKRFEIYMYYVYVTTEQQLLRNLHVH